ncbi:MAG: flagellar biosynthetic protein FliO [Oscillospiraceae bacterium]|nr:flagellar biosynthetic protein FliO [Oscillospiraceae bacterium]
MGISTATSIGTGAAGINNSTGAGDFFFTILIYVIVLGLIIGGFIYFRKYMLNRVTGIKSGSNIKLRDRLIIAQDKQIILLEVRDKILMVGVSTQNISLICEFEKNELYDKDDDGQADGLQNKKDRFKSMLSEKIRAGFGNIEKNKKN